MFGIPVGLFFLPKPGPPTIKGNEVEPLLFHHHFLDALVEVC
jgi:hypothetical protein